jgi:hypothetical protein
MCGHKSSWKELFGHKGCWLKLCTRLDANGGSLAYLAVLTDSGVLSPCHYSKFVDAFAELELRVSSHSFMHYDALSWVFMQGCPTAHYALLMMGSHVIAADRAKQQPALEPLDVLLLANFITSNHSYRQVTDSFFLGRRSML